MFNCTKCGEKLEPRDSFCGKCGHRVGVSPTAVGANSGTKGPTKKKNIVRVLLFSGLLWVVIGIIAVTLLGKGCSKAGGTFVSSGKPFGTVNFQAKSCKSGQREQFFGAYVLGEDKNAGGIKLVKDPVKGYLVFVEIPGSCVGKKCKVVALDKSHCKPFSATLKRTTTTVNDITLLEGSLKFSCNFPGGGTAKADINLESCD